MKKNLRNTISFTIAVIISIPAFSQTGYFGEFFIHEANVGNITNNYTTISHPGLNSNSSAKMIVAHNWGSSGVYADFKYGVWYSGSSWNIFSEETSMAFTDGTKWNVLLPSSDNGEVFSHTSTALNISSNYTIIDNAALNGNPDAVFFITHNWGSNGEYNNNNTGVWYDGANWAIYNENSMPFPEGVVYDIFVPDAGNANAFKHTTTSSNSVNNYSTIDNALTNAQPDRIIFATHNFGPVGGVENDNPIGVFYASGYQKWAVYNENDVDMPEGAVFNILVVDSMSTGIEEQTANADFITVFPNPASETQTIGYVLKEQASVSLKIVNLMGQEVKTVFTGSQLAGNYTINAALSELVAGNYYYLLNVNGAVSRKALIKQ